MKKRTLANLSIIAAGGIALAGVIIYQNADKLLSYMNAMRLEHKMESGLMGIKDVNVTECNENGFVYRMESENFKSEVCYNKEKNLLLIEENNKHNSAKTRYYDFESDGVLDKLLSNEFTTSDILDPTNKLCYTISKFVTNSTGAYNYWKELYTK